MAGYHQPREARVLGAGSGGLQMKMATFGGQDEQP